MTADSLNRKKQITGLILHTILFLDTAVIAVLGIVYGAGDGQVGDHVIGWGYLKPYTMDSNILAAVSSLVLIVCGIRNLKRGRECTPRWAVIFQLMGTASLCLTMAVAVFFLTPMMAAAGRGWLVMFRGEMFFFHLVNPILAASCFAFLQKHCRLSRTECLFGAIPTVIYSFVYLIMVALLHRWNDFYNFTFGGRYALIPAVFIVIYALVLLASRLLVLWHNRLSAGTVLSDNFPISV